MKRNLIYEHEHTFLTYSTFSLDKLFYNYCTLNNFPDSEQLFVFCHVPKMRKIKLLKDKILNKHKERLQKKNCKISDIVHNCPAPSPPP